MIIQDILEQYAIREGRAAIQQIAQTAINVLIYIHLFSLINFI